VRHDDDRDAAFRSSLVAGRVFFEDVLVRPDRDGEIALFDALNGKGRESSTSVPPLYTSFAMPHRLTRHERILVDRIHVTLTTLDGWSIDPEVVRWLEVNVRLRIEVNRIRLCDDFLEAFTDHGYPVPTADWREHVMSPSMSPRGPIDSDCEIDGSLRVMRAPGRSIEVIARVEAIGAWIGTPPRALR
jgi:hypothetical protein